MASEERGTTEDSSGAAPHVVLRPLDHADDLRIRRWIATPDVQRWWGSAASAEAEIRLARDSGAAIARMIVIDGETAGYAHAIDAGQLGALPQGVPAGVWACDLFIGAPEFRGRGLGACALELLAGEVFRSSLALACMILVSVKNERAARAYERIGFRWSSIHPEPLRGPCWVMLGERPARRRQ